MLNGKTILITGGTGSFGRQFIETTVRDYPGVRKIIVYSRDEMKQLEMRRLYPSKQYPQLRFFVGDVRDKERLTRACENVDIIIHAASMMSLESSEYNPEECVKTNVIGAQNVIDVALKCGVHDVIALSSDKACSPVNLYGATQLVSDKLFVAANNIKGQKDIKYSVVRYGNVMGSKGSVISFFISRRNMGLKDLPITDKRMTRYLISIQEVVNMVYYAIERHLGGEIFIPKMNSYHITDLAVAIAPNMEQQEVGIRLGEKLHEDLISRSDASYTIEANTFYAILPAISFVGDKSMKAFVDHYKAKVVPEGFNYSSDTNTEWETVDSLRDKIRKYVDHNFRVK